MRITRSVYEKALEKHYGVVGVTRTGALAMDTLSSSTGAPSFVVNPRPFAPQVEAVLRELGIEIVPDPEPETALPPRPWRVESEPCLHVAFGDGTKASDLNYTRYVQAVRALVSAYNAAGERKRIEVLDRGPANEGRWLKATVNGEGDEALFANATEAIGWYVRNHASDLGLEIVES